MGTKKMSYISKPIFLFFLLLTLSALTFSNAHAQFNLDILKSGTGAGTVRSNPGGIDCGSDCHETYGVDTIIVTLTAAPALGSYFAGWTGDCVSQALTCKVTMDATKTVTATFTLGTPSVNTWAKKYGGPDMEYARSIQQTKDGGFIVAGNHQSSPSTHQLWVLKLGADSSIEWEKSYTSPGVSTIQAESVQQTSDGGYIIAGQSQTPTNYWILKLRDDGSVEWLVMYNRSTYDHPRSITETSDGGYIVAGITTQEPGNYDIWVVKLRGDGSIEWNNTYGTGGQEGMGVSIKETSGGGYILATAGSTLGLGNWDAWVLKLNPDGSIDWQNAYGGTAGDIAYSVQETSEGGYIIAGSKAGAWLMKLAQNGALSWSKTYSGPNYGDARSVRQTSDGGYVIVGYTQSFGAGGNDIWVIKVDSSGNIIWEKTYGTSQQEQAFSIEETADGGFAVVGQTSGGNYDIWVLKMDSGGNINGCTTGLTIGEGHSVEVTDVTSVITIAPTTIMPMEWGGYGPFYVTPTVTNVALLETEICTGIPPCSYSINPTSASYPAGGGGGSVSVFAPLGCSWNSASNDSWIIRTSGASGSGNGTVTYSVAINTGPARTGTMAIAGQTFTVNQASGCHFTINPTSLSHSSSGGPGSFTITASDSACSWTALSRDPGWITITPPGSGTGDGAITYSVSANSGSSRTGTITVGGVLGVYHTVDQEAQQYLLTISKSGPGMNIVTSTPPGIDCGGDCSEAYDYSTVVTLEAEPENSNFIFMGWSDGGCSGTNPCIVTITSDLTVTALFDIDTDGDGIPDSIDNCPLIINHLQLDFDVDGIGDACDKDADGDGFLSIYHGGCDCDDLNPNVYPGNGCPDVCGSPAPKSNTPTDSDGDGVADISDSCPYFPNTNQVIPTWHKDADNDGYAETGAATKTQCTRPTGYKLASELIATTGDCNDDNAAIHPATVWYKDTDGDLYSDGTTQTGCTQPSGYRLASQLIALSGDCDDNNSNVNPGKTEISNNGIDDDDCNPNTPDLVNPYNIVFEMPDYDTWLPGDGNSATVTASVKGPNNETYNVPISFSIKPMINYPGKYTNDSSADINPDFAYSFSGNTITLTSLDFGGSITITAGAWITLVADQTPVFVQNNFTLPKDIDADGLADKWEMDKFQSLIYGALDDPDNDGLSNFKEYRGFMWGKLVSVAVNDTYKTAAYIAQGDPVHFRTNPQRKDLFVKFSNHSAAFPFAIGAAFSNAGVDVHAVDAIRNLGENNIGVATINYGTKYGLENGHINKRGIRDWDFDTLGYSGIGNASTYGSATIYQEALNYYFIDKPYKDLSALGKLDSISSAQDKNDNGINDKVGNKYETGCVTCPWITDVVVMVNYVPDFNWNLNPMDINNNGMVELPLASDPNQINQAYEYTLAQTEKHVTTHELGHAVGMTENSDGTCVMYQYSTNWSRDGKFSDYAKGQMKIHNP